jgi:hypothetical protein
MMIQAKRCSFTGLCSGVLKATGLPNAGQLVVKVHQVVRDLNGNILADRQDTNPNDIANVFNAGMHFMIAGDDLDTGGCEYYRKAETVFQTLAPRLQGDRAETQGRTVRLGPFRTQDEEQISRVEERLRHCGAS